MSKVRPYYSTNPTDPDVYHVHDDCPRGLQIPARNKVTGAPPAGYRLCKVCEDMG